MLYKLENKKIIVFLTVGFVVLLMLLWHKQEKTNNTVPKKAQYVLNISEWRKNNG